MLYCRGQLLLFYDTKRFKIVKFPSFLRLHVFFRLFCGVRHKYAASVPLRSTPAHICAYTTKKTKKDPQTQKEENLQF